MSSARVADNSHQWVNRLGLKNKMLTRFYKGTGVRWNSDSAFSREVFDWFTARVLVYAGDTTRHAFDDSYVFDNWQKILCGKLGREAGNSIEGSQTIAGAHAWGWLSVDFACWAARHSDELMSAYGSKMLSQMLRSGFTSVIQVPETSDMYSDVTTVMNQVVLDDGDYASRFLRAWGDDDIRIIEFYRLGFLDRSFIERCIADGVDPQLANSVIQEVR